jgi:iron complex transport system ATP-binding protein
MSQRSITRLSGGERRRIAIASILTQDPDIFLLDEPDSHLDMKYQIKILQQLTDHVQQHRRSIVMSIHDINLAARFCTHILLLFGDGLTEAGLAADKLQDERLSKVFGHPIKSSMVDGSRIFLPT